MKFGAVALLASVLLVGCGGGGGGGDGNGGGSANAPDAGSANAPAANTLFVAVKFNADFSLFQEGRSQPTLSGFQGNTPNCSLASGSLPAGVQLRGDCSFAGRPTQGGLYPVTVRVTVGGFTGHVDFADTVAVATPVVTYEDHAAPGLPALPRGSAINDAARISGWQPAAGESVGWHYAVVGGTLAPGLSLHPETGAITGTVTAEGAFTAMVQARLTTPYGTYLLPATSYSMNVNIPIFTFFTNGDISPTGYFRAYAGRPYGGTGAAPPDGSSVTTTLADFRLPAGVTLPPGLALDGASGNIRGTPTALTAPRDIPVEATITVFGVSNTAVATLKLEVAAPGFFSYGTGLGGRVGTPLVQDAFWTTVDASTFAVTRTAAERPGACTLPPGITLHPVSGQMTGTPTRAGTFECTVDFAVTVDSTTWTQPAVFSIVIE